MESREIKFRGKRLDSGEWVYGDLLHPKTSCRIVNYTDCKDSTDGMIGVDYHYHDVDEKTICQFTGIKLNGKELYEGDILKSSIGEDYCVVEWNDQGFVMHSKLGRFPLWKCNLNGMKISGNKFDNLELLK